MFTNIRKKERKKKTKINGAVAAKVQTEDGRYVILFPPPPSSFPFSSLQFEKEKPIKNENIDLKK